MRYFLDTEFSEDGRLRPITLISIGIVAEDGREYYAVSSEFKEEDCNPWVQAHVLPYLGESPPKLISEIASELVDFCRGREVEPEFWGYYADYDWVVLCQLFGAMVNLPRGWPMFCRDLKQWAVDLGNPPLPKQVSVEHNALEDARWNAEVWKYLQAKARGEI